MLAVSESSRKQRKNGIDTVALLFANGRRGPPPAMGAVAVDRLSASASQARSIRPLLPAVACIALDRALDLEAALHLARGPPSLSAPSLAALPKRAGGAVAVALAVAAVQADEVDHAHSLLPATTPRSSHRLIRATCTLTLPPRRSEANTARLLVLDRAPAASVCCPAASPSAPVLEWRSMHRALTSTHPHTRLAPRVDRAASPRVLCQAAAKWLRSTVTPRAATCSPPV